MKTMNTLLLTVATLLFPVKGFSQSSTVPWSAFDMGFVVSSSPTTTLQSAVGQGLVGTTYGTNSTMYSGFLADTLFRGAVTSVAEEGRIPEEYALHQNYPNPFNPSTTIEFALPHAGYVMLRVYNVLGEEVATLISGDHAAGMFKAMWDVSGMPSGVYFYRLTAGEYVQTRKMILMK